MLRPYNIGHGDRGAVLAPVECPQVHQAAVWSAEKRTGDRLAPEVALPRLAHPHGVAGIVDVVGAARSSAQRSQVPDAGSRGPPERPTAPTHDLAAVIDRQGDADGPAECAEVADPGRRRPAKGVRLAPAALGEAYDFPPVVHVVRHARRPAEAPEVEHLPRLRNEERVLRDRPRPRPRPPNAAVPGDLRQPVERQGLALVPSQGAEIEAEPLGQEERVKIAESGVSATNDLAPLVDVVGRAVDADRGTEVGDPRMLVPAERPAATQLVPTRAHYLPRAVHGLGLTDGAAQRAQLADRDYRRPSSVLAHNPACTAVSGGGPSSRRTRSGGRPFRR